MRKQKKKVRLYHLSEENHDGEIFKPRVPESISDDPEYEDQKTKRVCFASSMAGAFRAISIGCVERFYVHVPVNIETIIKKGKLFKPSEYEVYDVYETGEYWVKCQVKLKCIGFAEFMSYETSWNELDGVRMRWIEKYV